MTKSQVKRARAVKGYMAVDWSRGPDESRYVDVIQRADGVEIVATGRLYEHPPVRSRKGRKP